MATNLEKPKKRTFTGKTSPHPSDYSGSSERNFHKKLLKKYLKGYNHVKTSTGEKIAIAAYI